jgi:hypothetical protein
METKLTFMESVLAKEKIVMGEAIRQAYDNYCEKHKDELANDGRVFMCVSSVRFFQKFFDNAFPDYIKLSNRPVVKKRNEIGGGEVAMHIVYRNGDNKFHQTDTEKLVFAKRINSAVSK